MVDADKQLLRSVVDAYMESGDSFLFDEQVISITSQSREHSYALIIDAIKRAIRASFTSKQTTPVTSPASVEAIQPTPERAHDLASEPESKADDKRVHDETEEERSGNNNSSGNNVQTLKAALLANFGSSNDQAW